MAGLAACGGGQQPDDRDRLLAVRAVPCRGRLQRVPDRSLPAHARASRWRRWRWRWRQFDPARMPGDRRDRPALATQRVRVQVFLHREHPAPPTRPNRCSRRHAAHHPNHPAIPTRWTTSPEGWGTNTIMFVPPSSTTWGSSNSVISGGDGPGVCRMRIAHRGHARAADTPGRHRSPAPARPEGGASCAPHRAIPPWGQGSWPAGPVPAGGEGRRPQGGGQGV